MARWPSLRICTASLIHLVGRSCSLSMTVVFFQSIVWLSWFAWSASANLLYSVRLAVRWLLVKARLVLVTTSVLCSCSLTPNFLQFLLHKLMSCHSWHKEPCIYILLCLPCLVCPSGAPINPSMSKLGRHWRIYWCTRKTSKTRKT